MNRWMPITPNGWVCYLPPRETPSSYNPVPELPFYRFTHQCGYQMEMSHPYSETMLALMKNHEFSCKRRKLYRTATIRRLCKR